MSAPYVYADCEGCGKEVRVLTCKKEGSNQGRTFYKCDKVCNRATLHLLQIHPLLTYSFCVSPLQGFGGCGKWQWDPVDDEVRTDSKKRKSAYDGNYSDQPWKKVASSPVTSEVLARVDALETKVAALELLILSK